MSIQLNLSTHGPELKAAYKEVVDKTCSTNWILLSYTKGSNELKVAGKGDGGLEELSEEFEDDKVLFALAQVTDPNSYLPKLVFISWCGEGAPVQRKGLLPSHLGHVQKFFEGYHVQINARDAEDVTPEQILKKIEEGSGAKYSYHEQVRSQTPASQSPKPVVAQTPLTTSSYKKPVQPSPPVSKPDSPRAPAFKPSQASSNLQNRYLQQVDQGYTERQAREEQERVERAFLQKSQPKASQSPRSSGVSSRVQDARDREERELQERLEKARISRSSVSTSKPIPSRDIGSQENDEALQNAKRLEEERRREAELEEQRKADRLQKERQRAEEEAQQKEREREQLRLEREREEKSRQETLESERLQRERELQEQEQRELKAREQEQKVLEARQKEEREIEARQKEQAEREKVEQDRRNEEAQREKERQDSYAKEAEQSMPATEGESNLTAIALFDYAAIDETEVNLKEGELVTGIQQIDEGWWQGANESGQFGLFPANYVELVAPPEPCAPQEPASTQTSEASKSQKHAVALYDYEASEQGELSFGAADTITNIDFLSDDWWQGTNPEGQTGLFPANYVELQ